MIFGLIQEGLFGGIQEGVFDRIQEGVEYSIPEGAFEESKAIQRYPCNVLATRIVAAPSKPLPRKEPSYFVWVGIGFINNN